METWLTRIGAAILALVAAVYLMNASWLAPAPTGELKIIAHRGVHQQFSREGLTNETCTAERMLPPAHDYLENTLRSMEAAFGAGADMIEIDIHPTTDGEFAVFHDWTLDCRTDGSGVTREQSMADLRKLDLGYGYTADGGKTFPFRGKGVGLMPTLHEVLQAFPDRMFMINDKAGRADDAERLAVYFAERADAHPERLVLVSAPNFAARWRELSSNVPVLTRRDAKACAKGYVMTGWFGRVSDACKGLGIAAPVDFAWLYWGWPRRLEARFEDVGLGVMLVGPLNEDVDGIDTLPLLDKVPDDYAGWIVTNRIEQIGPAAKARAAE